VEEVNVANEGVCERRFFHSLQKERKRKETGSWRGVLAGRKEMQKKKKDRRQLNEEQFEGLRHVNQALPRMEGRREPEGLAPGEKKRQ